MKRSKVFLTLSAAVLAIAAFATSRASHRSIKSGYFTTANSKGLCSITTSGNFLKNGASGNTAHASNGATIHTRASGTSCGATLYTGE